MDNPTKDLFKEVNKVVAEPIRCGKSVLIRWPYKSLEKDMIESVRGTCGCSVAEYNDKEVTVTYNDSTSPSSIPKDKGFIQVDKLIIVYLKDGKPLKVINAKGVEVFNEEKLQIPLTFSVTVIS